MALAIAIDGPAASGKSSAAEIVAKVLGFQRVDSGLLYRAITYLVFKNFNYNTDLDLKSKEIKDFVDSLEIIQKNSKIFFKNEDITEELRTPFIDSIIGKVAKELFIREKTHEIQHNLIHGDLPGVVIDGRDIGTVVVPNAFIKFFITADATTRANRRSKQTGEDYNEVLEKLQKRDYDDINRKHGPLKQAEDAILIENDNITLQETVNKIVNIVKERLNSKKDELKDYKYLANTIDKIKAYEVNNI